MDQIYCCYYDEEMEQDVPLQPNADEAILFFKNFIWENEDIASTMKTLSFQAPEDEQASLLINSLEKNKWCIYAQVSIKRRFLGPFFKRNISKIFIDEDELETEKIIRLFYENTPDEFTKFLQISGE